MGLGSLGFQVMRTTNSDPIVISTKAILVGFAAQCLLNSVMIGVLGFMVWTFASMCLAAADYAKQTGRAGAEEESGVARMAAA
jgi:hypothetical protein